MNQFSFYLKFVKPLLIYKSQFYLFKDHKRCNETYISTIIIYCVLQVFI